MNINLTLSNIQDKKFYKDNLKNTDFIITYEKLIKWDFLTDNEKFLLLKVAVIFLNQDDKKINKFWYSIILKYSNLFQDYIPLYDIALNKNYIPIAKFIHDKYFTNSTFSDSFKWLLMSSYKELFKTENNIYFSWWQLELNNFSDEHDSSIIVAPTSYWKSELILSKIIKNISKNIVIIVPTKSLLSQTKKRLIEKLEDISLNKKLITHPDMYRNDKDFIAILTQERLLRLIKLNKDLTVDLLFIDEAHNILKNDERWILLVKVIKILQKRNKKLNINYFTPFLFNPDKIKILSKGLIPSKKIDEYMKIEKIYIYSTWKWLELYDQFLDKNFKFNNNIINDDYELLKTYSWTKNIIYLNSPKELEKFVKDFNIDINIINPRIKKIINDISDFLDSKYYLINSITKGIVYHHWWMPDIVRMYVEDSFSDIKELKYIVTNSTLLEWVNIPADTIFILSKCVWDKHFTSSQFKNLVWRVSRFKDIFSNKYWGLEMLEPKVFVKSWISFVQKRISENLQINDNIENIFIKNDNNLKLTDNEEVKLKKELDYIENIEPWTIPVDTSFKYINSEIWKLCFYNDVHDFDIYLNEEILIENLNNFKKYIRELFKINNDINILKKINSSDLIISAIYQIFIKNIKFHYSECSSKYKTWEEKKVGTYCWRLEWDYSEQSCKYCKSNNENLLRFKNEKTQRFYSKFLSWKSEWAVYKKMIWSMLKYWNWLESDEKMIYVGQRWGEIKRNETDHKKLYVNLNEKNDTDKINLAIVRIKEELDFIDYNLFKYIEIINELWLIDELFYKKIKYWTSEQKEISLFEEWLSPELCNIITKEPYSQFIKYSDNDLFIWFDNKIYQLLIDNNINWILINELKYYLKI